MVLHFHNGIIYLLLKNPPTLRSPWQAKIYMQKLRISLVVSFLAAAEILNTTSPCDPGSRDEVFAIYPQKVAGLLFFPSVNGCLLPGKD